MNDSATPLFHRGRSGALTPGRAWNNNVGSAILELALVLSFLGVPLLLGTIETGVLLFNYSEIANAAHVGAVYGMRSMLPANDLGLPTRLVPIARALADRGHDVAVFNPAPVPAILIEDAGLKNLPMPSRPMPDSPSDLAQASSAWDVEQMFGALFGDEEFVRAATAMHVDLIRDFNHDGGGVFVS